MDKSREIQLVGLRYFQSLVFLQLPVFLDDHQVFDPLVSDYSQEPIVMIEDALSKLEVSGEEDGLQIAFISQIKDGVELLDALPSNTPS